MPALDTKFRDPNVARRVAGLIADSMATIRLPTIRLMEVCGTHTTAIFRCGIASMLPERLLMLSGPGCPVCVTPVSYLDRAIEIRRRHGVIITTFGDMIKVPGSLTTLERERATGADVRMVYSPLDALDAARANPDAQVVFLAVGFETTAPAVAATVLRARELGVRNFSVLSAHKVVPPALSALVDSPDVGIHGFLLPGHVSAIIGAAPYRTVAAKGVPCVIAGFEPVDVLQSVLMLLEQLTDGRAEVEIQYTRCVRPDGNPAARELMARVFAPEDAEWRGLGVIPASGLAIAGEFAEYDAALRFPVELPASPPEGSPELRGCICGEVLRGARRPTDCGLFGVVCTPATPVGACMVSSEGTCAAYFKYRR